LKNIIYGTQTYSKRRIYVNVIKLPNNSAEFGGNMVLLCRFCIILRSRELLVAIEISPVYANADTYDKCRCTLF
jgi:hypothetical protein